MVQVQNLEAWQGNTINGQESEGAEHAVTWLQANGYDEAKRVCPRQFHHGALVVQLDGLAVGDDVAAVVESKTIAHSKWLESLQIKMEKLKCAFLFVLLLLP